MRWAKGNLNIIHLRTLQAVIRAGSHSAAAKQLGYTTSAVSQQIAALEKSAGVELFERGPRNLWPTAAGLAMDEHSNRILKLVVEAEDDMANYASGASGRLRVAATGAAAAQLIPRALARLAAQHSNINISVQNAREGRTLIDDVLEGFADLVILYDYDLGTPQWPEGLVAHTVMEEELVMVASPDSGTITTRISLADFSAEQWVANDPGSADTDYLLQACEREGFQPDIKYFSNDFDVIRGFVKERLGVALMPALALGIDRSIQMCRINAGSLKRRVLVAHRSSDSNQLLPATLAALQDAAEEFLQWTRTAFLEPQETPLGAIGERISSCEDPG
ncbi:LysR family transcriptional regulator [Glutamicibacter sp. JL.03c]|uniref:LysR family transcriptional regulator n=1 Tax=Glutamicibacter sp. JL.03c TaxID=2984842 RepID=UPI0021F6AA33|nr:LysR family transcriptional regulator [Glutamicibacter sp. JL.03c]UYQ76550.1 LysR family transcriptional regulator [Glutamicibacter sp. JL.03c]